jgi:two-component system, NarL family, nitrate/nitrite response regulator NarL
LPCHLIILLDENNPELIVEAFRNGARGIFCRTGSSGELRKCLERVCAGQIWASNAQLECVLQALTRVPAPVITRPPVTAALSKREEEVARPVASGFSNREISKKLGLSPHTVKNYLFRVYEKLGFATRIELVLYMLSQTKRPVAQDDAEVPTRAQKLRA